MAKIDIVECPGAKLPGHDMHGEQNRMAEDNKERERAGYLAYL